MPVRVSATKWSGILLLLSSLSFSQARIPVDIYQRARELMSNLHVMVLSIQPGDEDPETIACFRFEHGAKVLSVYLTNGEGGWSDVRGEYPHELAATRRQEAWRAMRSLNCESYFMNFPDVPAASDTSSIRKVWLADSLQRRLVQIITQFRPDILLMHRNQAAGGEDLRIEILKKDVLQALKMIEPRMASSAGNVVPSQSTWRVKRFLLEEPIAGRTPRSVRGFSPSLLKKNKALSDEARQLYVSMHVQLWNRGPDSERTYSNLTLANSQRVTRIDDGLPLTNSSSFRWIESSIQTLSKQILRASVNKLETSVRRNALNNIVAIMDSVDSKIPRSYLLSLSDRKSIVHWKEGLENLRNALLKVSLTYRLSDSVVAPRQITFLTIDALAGASSSGTTEVYFPGIQQQWNVNEAFEPKLPLVLRTPYRLLSPPAKVFDLPLAENGSKNELFMRPFFFYVIHKSASPESSFVVSQSVSMFYAPKFTAEILSPIVLVQQAEPVAIRLTNHSRDGLKDSVYVDDTLAVSDKRPFRLPAKESVHIDTLHLRWKKEMSEGTYLLNVSIGGLLTGRFAARNFSVKTDSSLVVSVIPGTERGALVEALRRLRIRTITIDPAADIPRAIFSAKVLIIDRRAFTLHPNLLSHTASLTEFVNKGGRLIVLAQDADRWKEAHLWEGIELEKTFALDANLALKIDTTSSVFQTPNPIAPDDFLGWLFSKAFNRINVKEREETIVLVSTMLHKKEFPLVVTHRMGTGKITYVDLNLDHQWLNVNPGALRFLANLIAF